MPYINIKDFGAVGDGVTDDKLKTSLTVSSTPKYGAATRSGDLTLS